MVKCTERGDIWEVNGQEKKLKVMTDGGIKPSVKWTGMTALTGMNFQLVPGRMSTIAAVVRNHASVG